LIWKNQSGQFQNCEVPFWRSQQKMVYRKNESNQMIKTDYIKVSVCSPANRQPELVSGFRFAKTAFCQLPTEKELP
jgi:hypothetical protein